MRHSERGSTLVVAVVIVLVIAVVGVGMVRFTHRQVASATAGMRTDTVAACVEAGRKLLLSRFHAFGTSPTDLEVLDARIDGPNGRMRVMGGHLDADPAHLDAAAPQVEIRPDLVHRKGGGNLSNRIVGAGGYMTGGRPYRAVVHCQEGDLSGLDTGRQIEIEFAVNFGL